jgi:hypothetical protein
MPTPNMFLSRAPSFIGAITPSDRERSRDRNALTHEEVHAYSLPRTLSYNTFTPPNEPAIQSSINGNSKGNNYRDHTSTGLSGLAISTLRSDAIVDAATNVTTGPSSYRIARSLSPDPLRSDRGVYRSRYGLEEDNPFPISKHEIEQDYEQEHGIMAAGVNTRRRGWREYGSRASIEVQVA